ncbi:anthranilate synthase subunit I [Skermanella stibiiresistens SB22]|uniref:Anthranilate synthase n=1 Tax=Skermanella stibiiresistens SB22 TaxID=1385369 RepID=W9H5Z2_9PROT|nr:anthranilate synthase [Skermanella stibiiresistens]EWY40211.1 anthranilate synthase subunit I [Skermanella stibiiresistens SB22]
MDHHRDTLAYRTRGGIRIERRLIQQPYQDAVEPLIDALERSRGALLSSSFDYPGRYTRWDLGFVDPPVMLTARERTISIEALNPRGGVLVRAIGEALEGHDALERLRRAPGLAECRVRVAEAGFAEEERSRQPSVFSVLRAISDLFGSDEDHTLGLYGAFGYDLAFQFEAIRQRLERADDQRDLVLYLPDEILVVDHHSASATIHHYEFTASGERTHGLARATAPARYDVAAPAGHDGVTASDHGPGEYAAAVERAREAFKRGDLFEVVLSQTFSEPSASGPATLFRRLRAANPSPYGALINLGEGEFLVAASPEMYVRVEGRRIETCPISGTIARGADAIGDAAQILTLLNSAKDASELTMCTDVDRNDKSRICEPGSVRVIGRRQVELYSRLIHTVDHVEGTLRDGFDALDGFLSHTWAVTVTGAPKRHAMSFVEGNEKSPRRWYGGAIGCLTFDGGMNTGLTLRTIRLRQGVAEVRVGATLLFDSDPEAEDAECRLKGSALFAAIRHVPGDGRAGLGEAPRLGVGKRVLLVDHEDSFVHTLGDYFRRTGAEVTTLRPDAARARLTEIRPELLVLSPGPGRPADFDIAATLDAALARDVPVFGVCLGLQGIAEYFGGRLGVLDRPMHGKPSRVRLTGSGRAGGRTLAGLPTEFTVGRYHSLFAETLALPADLEITALAEDGVVMAIEHRDLPIAAVQFHPESIMSLDGEVGPALIARVVEFLAHSPIEPDKKIIDQSSACRLEEVLTYTLR